MRDLATTANDQTLFEQAKAQLREGSISERDLQRMLKLTPSRARRLTDSLVDQGVAYRTDRMLVLNQVKVTCAPDSSLEAPILKLLERGPNTVIQMSRELGRDAETIRATAEELRSQGFLSGSCCGPLMIYKRIWSSQKTA